MRREPAAFVVVATLALAACGFVERTPAPPPTEAEAIAYLDELVVLAQAGALEAMCVRAEDGGGNCNEIARDAGGQAAVPRDPPFLAGTRLIPSQRAGDGWQTGGMLLVLCGTDGLDRFYRTEMLVSNGLGERHVINAVYWSGFRLAVSGNTGDPSGGEGIDCPR